MKHLPMLASEAFYRSIPERTDETPKFAIYKTDKPLLLEARNIVSNVKG
jgi:hypothetical protein